MSLSRPFILRPVATTLLTLAIFLIGAIAYPLLPVAPLPQVEFPTLQVSASLPGASPETMASSVATPLENRIALIPGITQMTSASGSGATSITVQFELDVDIDAAAQEVQSAINTAIRDLPRDLPAPPNYRKVNPADSPIMLLSLRSETRPITEVSDFAATVVAQQLSQVKGVAQVNVMGEQKPAVRVQLDPDRLAALGLAFEDVRAAIGRATVNAPKGTIDGERRTFTIYADDQLLAAEDYDNLVLAYRAGAPIRVRDVGRAIAGAENARVASWAGTQRGVALVVFKQAGANVIETVERITALLPQLREGIPPSITLDVMADRTRTIRASVQEVQFTLLLTMGLVVGIVFLFLRNIRATFIASLVVPTSIVATFAAMYVLDYSLDNLSLMGLTIAVGFVIDDAIVMLENIYVHLEKGSTPAQAALDGAKEMGFTILSITLSLVAVFIPALLMGGIVGRLFREFAVVIGLAVLISGFISLSLTPMLSSRFLAPPREVEHHGLFNFFERFFAGMLRVYEKGLRWSLAHRRITMLYTLVITLLTVVVFARIPKGFIPSQDIGQLFGQTEAVEGISFEEMARHQQEVAKIVREDPNIEAFMSSAGGRGSGASNTGNLFVRLKPRAERTLNADQVVESLRPRFAQVPGIRVYLQNPPALQIGGRMSRSQYQLTLTGPDTDELYRVAPLLEGKLRGLRLLTDVSTDLLLRNPQVNVDIARDKAASFGVTAQQIEDTLYSAYGQRQVSTIFAPNNQYRVIMEMQPEFQRQPADLRLLYVRSAGGQLVPLDSLVTLTPGVGPLAVNHSGQVPSVTLSFNLAPGVALSQATDEVDRLARETLPATVTPTFQGTAQAFKSSMQGLGLLLVLAILVIYMVLGILYESFIHPLTILSALPLAGLGALLTLMAFGSDLNIYAFVGIIMLVGLVKKNGIIMIDFALEVQRHGGKTPLEAIHEACVVRFRPIMMTTMAALFGTLPIALGFGAGAEARRPLGLAVVGGLLLSQSLTLFVTPVVYTYMESLQERMGRALWFLRGREREVDAAS